MQTRDRTLPLDLTFDSLVTFNESAQPQPALAIAWKHDTDFKRWEFQLRPGVKYHDGTPLTSASAAAALERFGAAAQGEAVVVRFDNPTRDLPQTISSAPIAKFTAEGARIGTGPFRVVAETSSRAVLKANDDYWGGRPYLDGAEIDLGRNLRDQALDFDSNKADVIELGFGDTRRAMQNGKRSWTSAPIALMALVFDSSAHIDEPVREALALSIDRATIHSVLLQRQGVPTGAILPQWMSGYAFLFPTSRDLDKARRLASGAAPVAISYDPTDATSRLIAERIAVNAREAGITVRPTPGAQAAARIMRMSVTSPSPWEALQSVSDALNLHAPGTLYEIEGALVRSRMIIPLFHLPEIYGLGPRVRGWAPTRWGGWKLESVWLAP